MPAHRYLIVNADDFGLSSGVNRGILEAHQHGIVTSASLMVRWPASKGAAELARMHPNLSLGLHIDLGEWTYWEGDWRLVYSVVPIENRVAVEEEVERQLGTFRQLVGRNPTHLDSHQHVHRNEPVRSVAQEIASRLNVPLRHYSGLHYCGDFYGQTKKGGPCPEAISVDGLIGTFQNLPPGFTELGSHPGYCNDLESMYSVERAQEAKTLSDPRVRAALIAENIELRSFVLAVSQP